MSLRGLATDPTPVIAMAVIATASGAVAIALLRRLAS
jgi:hypothetical protein